LQFQGEDAAKIQEEHGKMKGQQEKGDKKELKSQLYAKDEWDDKDFTWQEGELKPGFRRPVIIHRAILGSIERFSAILIEHLAGKWPFWISPRQIIVCPISEKALEYCESVYLYLHNQGFQASLDTSQGSINKKVRNAQLA
jgi:threonyl-tRNA synthetase